MYETMYYITAAVGFVSLLFALGLYRWHNEVELFAVISFAAWLVLTFESDNLVVTESGITQTFGSFSMQLFCAALAFVSALAIIGAVTGKWPVDDSREVRREAPV